MFPQRSTTVHKPNHFAAQSKPTLVLAPGSTWLFYWLAPTGSFSPLPFKALVSQSVLTDVSRSFRGHGASVRKPMPSRRVSISYRG